MKYILFILLLQPGGQHHRDQIGPMTLSSCQSKAREITGLTKNPADLIYISKSQLATATCVKVN